jgi:hypothetical protein
VQLTGTVITSPAISPVATGRIEWFKQEQRTRFELEAGNVAGPSGDLAVSGLVAVVVHGPVLDVTAGDRIKLFGTMYRPVVPLNPGQRDFTLINRRRGVLVLASCERAADIKVLQPGFSHHRWLAAIRRRARAAMLDHAYRGDEAFVPGPQRQALDRVHQPRGLGPADRLGLHGRQSDPVGEPVGHEVADAAEDEPQQQPLRAAEEMSHEHAQAN